MKIHTMDGVRNINIKTIGNEETNIITIDNTLTFDDIVLTYPSGGLNDYNDCIDLSVMPDNRIIFKFVGEGTITLTDADGNDFNFNINR
jgi:hypothetical protein